MTKQRNRNRTIGFIAVGIGVLFALGSVRTQTQEQTQESGFIGGGFSPVPAGSPPAQSFLVTQPPQTTYNIDSPTFPEYSFDTKKEAEPTRRSVSSTQNLIYNPKKDRIEDIFGQPKLVSTPTHRAVLDDETGKMTYVQQPNFPFSSPLDKLKNGGK
jgi:hypothetical protein